MIASLQGARDANEDRVQLLPIDGKGARLACVHDGHAGTEVVEALCVMWEERVRSWARTSDWSAMTTEHAMAHLRAAINHFSGCLRHKTSGAVSIAALCLADGRVVMAWLGDCEGCVFSKAHGIQRAQPLWVWDTAVHHKPTLSGVGGPVRTTPHSLLAGLDPAQYPMLFELHDGDSAEAHVAHAITLTALPTSAEYERCLQHCGHAELEVDVVTIRRGAYHAFADARLHCAVQPTRVFGDREMLVKTGVMRAPALLGTTTPTTPTTSMLLLLCSDGMFSEGAFPNLAAVVRCARAPTRYLQAELMRRPLFGGLAGFGALAERCRACDTWPQMLRFIAVDYLAALQRPDVIDAYGMLAGNDPIVTLQAALTTTTTTTKTTTLTDAKFKFKFNSNSNTNKSNKKDDAKKPRASSSSPPRRRRQTTTRRTSLDLSSQLLLPQQQLRMPKSYHHWLQTCVASIEWLLGAPGAQGAEALAHLAIVLGSSDNVSVMMLELELRPRARPAEALLIAP